MIGIAEAASRLGISQAAVRQRCRNGTLVASKSTGRWLVDEASISVLGGTAPGRLLHDRVDFANSLDQLELLDLIEEWVPDLLRHEDELADRRALLRRAKERLVAGDFQPPREVEVPKTPFFTRTGRLITLEDRIVFHAVVASFAHLADSALSKQVYSARLAQRGPYLTKKGTRQWRRWLIHVRRHLHRGEPWLIKTDLTAYFDTIKHDLLDAELQSVRAPADAREAIAAMLQAWTPLQGIGLLQGPDAARILGNLYLSPVDAAMEHHGISYSRYMDDIRITGARKSDVINAVRILERECRSRGLILSPNKTTLHSHADALTADEDAGRSRAMYFFTMGNFKEAKRRLRRLLKDSIADDGHLNARNFRFGLWRLAKLRDHYMLPSVLARLDDLAPAASVVAEYLRPYIATPRVTSGLAHYLTQGDNVRHPHLLFHLFAVMLEHPGPLPSSWTSFAEGMMRDTEQPLELRGVAVNLAVLSGRPAVIGWARTTARAHGSIELARACLVALARVSALDAATATTASRRDARLGRTVNYLERATSLPSISTARARVPIR